MMAMTTHCRAKAIKTLYCLLNKPEVIRAPVLQGGREETKENHWAVPLAHVGIISDSNAHSCYLVMKRKHPPSWWRKGRGKPRELLRRVDT